MPINIPSNHYDYSRYIVGDNTPYTTVQAAINAANAVGGGIILIRQGNYNENLTLYNNITLEGSGDNSSVINGTHTPPAVGTIRFKNLTLQSATNILSSAAAGTTIIYFDECMFIIVNGHMINLPNWISYIEFKNCRNDSTEDGIATLGSTAWIEMFDSELGAGTTQTFTAANLVYIQDCTIGCPVSLSGGSTATIVNSEFNNTITLSGTKVTNIYTSVLEPGANIALTTTSAGTTSLSDTTINSAAANVITGTGTVEFGSVTYLNSTGIQGTITKEFSTQHETGVLKISDASVGALSATTGLVSAGTLIASYGGTGNATNTIHGVLIGNAANAINATIAGTAAQVLQSGGAGADPNWSTATYPSTAAVGDVVYGSALNTISGLPFVATATRYLANTGGGATVPAWAQINLANGVTGILPVANGGTGVSSMNQNNIIYVGKHGNDANSGRYIEVAKLTFGSAITAAVALGVNAAVVCLDNGTYSESITLATNIDLYAPNALVYGTLTVVDNSSVKLNYLSGILVKSAGSGYAYVELEDMAVGADTTGIQCTSGFLFFDILRRIFLGTGTGGGTYTYGAGNPALTQGTIIGHIGYLNGGNNTIGVARGNSGTTSIQIDNSYLDNTGSILAYNATSSSSYINIIGNGALRSATTVENAIGRTNITANNIYATNTLYTMTSGTLNIDVQKIDGTATRTYVTGSVSVMERSTGWRSSFGCNLYNNTVVGGEALVGLTRSMTVSNTDNTNAASHAGAQITSGGVSGGDPYINFLVTGAGTFSVGVDNSDSDKFKITSGATPSAGTDLFTMTSAGVITLANDLDVSEGGTGVSTLTSHGFLFGNGAGDIQASAEPSSGQLPIGNTGNQPTLATLTAGAGISITNGAGSITIAGAGMGVSWVTATGNLTLVVNTGYITNHAAPATRLVYTMPATAAVGNTIAVVGYTAGGWKIEQPANVTIHYGAVATTVGAAGYLQSNENNDCVVLICVVADYTWVLISATGNITVN